VVIDHFSEAEIVPDAVMLAADSVCNPRDIS
jgi:hypothetical protein